MRPARSTTYQGSVACCREITKNLNSAEALADFWGRNQSSDWFQQHPYLAASRLIYILLCSLPDKMLKLNGHTLTHHLHEDLQLDRTVPLVLHGDDAESHRCRSYLVVTVGSAVVHASPWDSKLVVYVADNAQSCDETYTVLDTWVTWSLVELLLGHWLDVDPWGKPFERVLDAITLCTSITVYGYLYTCLLC